MAVLELNGCEMNSDILEEQSHFFEFMTDFFKDKEQISVQISEINRPEIELYYSTMREAQDECKYEKSLMYQTVHNPEQPDFLCKLSVRKMYVRKNRTKARAGCTG